MAKGTNNNILRRAAGIRGSVEALGMEHVVEALATWVSRWQVIVGLALFTGEMVAAIILTCVFPTVETLPTKRSNTTESERRQVNQIGLFRLMEIFQWQLLVYGSLKSSPGAAFH